MDVLEHLIEEHRKAEQMLQQLAQSQAGPDRERLLADLGDALALHMEVEEREVYPLVEQYLGLEKAAEAETEHNKARDDLARAVETVGSDQFQQALEVLTGDIRHHVQEEEGEVFPQLRQNAAGDIEALGDPEIVEAEVEEEVVAEENV